jgi:hypothetical protein
MSDFSSITSMKAVDDACREGRLVKALLLPEELGGQDIPENVVYIPPDSWELRREATTELLDVVSEGMRDVAVVPEYRGASLVPTKIITTAARSGLSHHYKDEILIW